MSQLAQNTTTPTSTVMGGPDDTTLVERQELGQALQEASSNMKRLVSPMLHYVVVQQILCEMQRDAKRDGSNMHALLCEPETIAQLEALLADLKALPEAERNIQPARHEPWVEAMRDQVDYIPGEGKAKRVVNVHELAEVLTLVRKMKDEGRQHFQEYDFAMAVTRYIQIINVLADIRAIRDEENGLIDEARHSAYRNLSLSALRNWEWGKARRASNNVLDADPDDYAVRLRRAEAAHQTGLFDLALSDLQFVLASDLPKDDILMRRAKRDLRRLKKADRESATEMRKTMAKGLAKGLFSKQREAAEPAHPDATPAVHPRLQRFLARSRAEGRPIATGADPAADAGAAGTEEGEEQKQAPAPAPARPAPVLTIEVATEIQRRQAELFAQPETQSALEKMRMDADFEEVRFLHRLQPFKLDVQRGLLAEFGYDQTAEGLRLMERHVAAHLDDSAVGERGKKLMQAIMGDIW